MANVTWDVDLEALPPALNCKWVFKVKPDSDGEIAELKAILVAKGCGQKPRVDFIETVSPVIRHASLRVMLTIAAAMDMELYHLDVDTAFLCPDLDDKVYMRHHEGLSDGKKRVVRLRKSVYGLKQSSQNRKKLISEWLLHTGWKQCRKGPCRYYCNHGGVFFMMLGLYVDDIPFASTSEERTSHFPAGP